MAGRPGSTTPPPPVTRYEGARRSPCAAPDPREGHRRRRFTDELAQPAAVGRWANRRRRSGSKRCVGPGVRLRPPAVLAGLDQQVELWRPHALDAGLLCEPNDVLAPARSSRPRPPGHEKRAPTAPWAVRWACNAARQRPATHIRCRALGLRRCAAYGACTQLQSPELAPTVHSWITAGLVPSGKPGAATVIVRTTDTRSLPAAGASRVTTE